jgi:hypothetical protein
VLVQGNPVILSFHVLSKSSFMESPSTMF